MTPEEGQKFFEEHGYYPTSQRVVKRAKASAHSAAGRLQSLLHSRFQAAWKQPLHWPMPRLFENSGQMYEMLGHEEFLRQVSDYWSSIGEARLEDARRIHVRWAIRQILRTFKTHVLGFRGQAVSRKGSVFPKASGQRKFGEGRRAIYEDILTLPEDLIAEGRLVADLDGYLRAYLVRPEDLEQAHKDSLAKLSATWGVPTSKGATA